MKTEPPPGGAPGIPSRVSRTTMQWKCVAAGCLALGLLVMAGCGTDYRPRSVIKTDKAYAMSWTEGVLRPSHWSGRTVTDPAGKYTFINPFTYNPSALTNLSTYRSQRFDNLTESYYHKAVTNAASKNEADRETARYYRNELQNALLRTIKEATDQHMASLKATENQANLVLGAATIGLAGGASVVGGTAAKALAASATGTAGARSLVNEQVYRNTFVESLIALIEKDQDEFLDKIKLRQTNSIINYTVEGAIMDAKEFEQRGSFYHGLSLLQKAVQNEVNKGTNSVAIGQLQSSGPSVTGVVPVTLRASTNGATPSVVDAVVSGKGFHLLDTGRIPQIDGMDGTVQVRLLEAYALQDSELTLRLSTTESRGSTNRVSVAFSYIQRNATQTLRIPLEIRIVP